LLNSDVPLKTNLVHFLLWFLAVEPTSDHRETTSDLWGKIFDSFVNNSQPAAGWYLINIFPK